MFAFQLTGPHERKALKGWIAEKGVDEDIDALLPKLKVGEARVWSPSWLNISETVKISEKRTFNASSTPEVGSSAKVRTLAPIDLERIRMDMAATIEKAKAEDPRELKKQIVDLKKQLAAKGGEKKQAVENPEIRRDVLLAAEKKGYERGAKDARRAWAPLGKAVDTAIRMLQANVPAELEWRAEPEAIAPLRKIRELVEGAANERTPRPIPSPAPPFKPKNQDQSDSALGKGDRQILAAIAQYPDGATRQQLTVLTGYKRSTRDRYIQYLQAAGRIVISGDRIRATESGIEALGPDFQPLPTGEELRKHWLDTLPEGESKILSIIIDAYPDAVARDAITEATGYQRSTRDRYIQYLQARQLVEAVGRGEVRASAELF